MCAFDMCVPITIVYIDILCASIEDEFMSLSD